MVHALIHLIHAVPVALVASLRRVLVIVALPMMWATHTVGKIEFAALVDVGEFLADFVDKGVAVLTASERTSFRRGGSASLLLLLKIESLVPSLVRVISVQDHMAIALELVVPNASNHALWTPLAPLLEVIFTHYNMPFRRQ